MRIAIDGSFSTGKTTLVNLLDGNKIVSPERELANRIGFNFNNHTFQERERFQKLLLGELLILEGEKQNFVTDTSLMTTWAYAGYTRKNIERILDNKHYDKVFYCPIEFSVDNDGQRNTDVQLRHHIDRQIKESYRKFNIKYIELRGSVTERLSTIITNIR